MEPAARLLNASIKMAPAVILVAGVMVRVGEAREDTDGMVLEHIDRATNDA